MSIMFVMNDITIGGAQRLFINLANQLAKRGHAVTLISLSTIPDRMTLVDEIADTVIVHRLSMASAYDFTSWFQLGRLLRSQKRGMVFSTLFLANTMVRILRLFHPHRIVVVEQNTYDEKPFSMILLDKMLSYVTEIIVCTSESVRTFTAAQERIPLSKFTVIHSGIDAARLVAATTDADRHQVREEFSIPGDARLFLDVARMTPQKGHSLLLESVAQLLSMPQYHDLYVLLVGEGGLQEALEAQAAHLGISERIVFAGARRDVARFYRAADYFISTSRIEGFSLVHAEAMAFGLPIVTTRTAGPDVMVIDGKTGFFVEGSPESVVDGCRKILASDYSTFRNAALERVSEFSLEETVSKYEKLAEHPYPRGLTNTEYA